MPKISLVAPVYGVEQYIDQFLESIRSQNFEDLEVILVDDGSRDRCPEIMDAFAKTDARYRVIHQQNAGVSAARNTGIEAASGEYIYIVDSDDFLAQNALEFLWAEAERTHADIIYGDWISERSGQSYYQKCFPHPFTTENSETIKKLQFAINNNNNKVNLRAPEFKCIYHLGGAPWRGMFRLSVIKDNGLKYDPYVRGLGDDILFSLHLYEYVKKVSYINKPIYHYRSTGTSYSHGYKEDYLETVDRIFEKQEEFLREFKKDEFAWGAYYTRVMIYLQQGMERYFKNMNNPKSEDERYAEFKETIKKQPYREAIRKAPIKYMGRKRLKYSTLMLRFHLSKLYWDSIDKRRNH